MFAFPTQCLADIAERRVSGIRWASCSMSEAPIEHESNNDAAIVPSLCRGRRRKECTRLVLGRHLELCGKQAGQSYSWISSPIKVIVPKTFEVPVRQAYKARKKSCPFYATFFFIFSRLLPVQAKNLCRRIRSRAHLVLVFLFSLFLEKGRVRVSGHSPNISAAKANYIIQCIDQRATVR